ncbi:MAG: glycosyltransferase family 2 protein [Chitinophagales bacterium]|nr:glycosyltransferase family 2 protein [Chitinophagales bacterium]
MQIQIDILLGTYNGEKFLDEQLESIFEQDYPNFRVIIRDDGSTDETLNIISKWIGLNPKKIEFIEDQLGNLGPSQNFNRLMQFATAPYICFSDQDDKWLPQKLSEQLNAIQKLEEKNPGMPIMVYSDMMLCDKDMKIQCPSLMENDRLNTWENKPNRLLIQNVPYACSTIINKKLLDLASPIDKRALMHDHWLALVSSLMGKLWFLDKALLYHRIHGLNASRDGSEYRKEVSDKISDKLNNSNFNNYLKKQTTQAEAILEQYEAKLDKGQIKMLKDFIALSATSGIKRKWLILKNRFFKNTFINTAKLIARA